MYFTSTSDENNGCCPRTVLKVNNKYEVNTLLDGGAVPNIISLDLVKKLGIKHLLQTHCKYITANGEKSQALGVAQGITINLLGKTLKIMAIVYNHDAFPLLLGRKSLKKLKVITDWDTNKWYMKGETGRKVIPINFDVHFGVKSLSTSSSTSASDSEMEEANEDFTCESETSPEETNNEVFVIQLSNELQQLSNSNENLKLQIMASKPEIPPLSDKEKDIKNALSLSISKVSSKFQKYIPDLRNLCFEFLDIFGINHKNLKPTNILKFDIDTGNAAPVYIKSQPLPYKYKEFIKSELDSGVAAGIMEGPLKQLCKWGFPVWAVSKPKTNELRMVGDFRVLNKRTTTDEFHIPDMKEIIEQLREATVYSPLDLLKAFHQVKLTPRAEEKLVLATEFGNYRYKVMPFGPKNAPATFAKVICIAFSEISDTVASYFDDVTAHSKEADSHLIVLRKAFEVARKYNLTLRPDKCLFFQDQIELLGHTVSPSGIKPSDKIINKVSVFAYPQNKTEVKSFVHLCGFHSENIQAFAEIAAPLTNLLRKETKFTFNSEEIKAWDTLKERTIKACEIAFFNPKFINKVYTDASDIGIGGVYTQINRDGEERPVKFLSRKMTLTESKYDTVNKELLGITYVLQKLRKYLLGRHFTLYTDSNAVKWLFTKKDISAKHSRYILLLQDFPCEVVHVSGKRNVVADILTRYPLQEAPSNSQELDYFPHILALEERDSEQRYEPIFNHIYNYIQTLSFENIPSDVQRRVHLERKTTS